MKKNLLSLGVNGLLSLGIAVLCLSSCTPQIKSSHVWLTSEAGDKCTEQTAVKFQKGTIENAIVVYPEDKRQTIDGFGNSVTESSVFVLACLAPEQRHAVLREMYGEEGANFSASRTVVGSSDFTLTGNYSYDDADGDTALAHFSMAVHQDGFSRADYPQVQDEHYDMWQCLHEIAAIKAGQKDSVWRLVASPWTAPAWMKDNKQFYDKTNRYGGALFEKYYPVYARYFSRYLDAYRASGIRFWAVTPENEPMGNDGSWESMHVSPAAEATLIGQYLGPQLQADGFGDVKILCFDQNTFEAAPYTAAVFGDSLASAYTDGTALHWYGSTISCFPEVLDSLHAAHPDKRLIHTEGCVDNLGRDGWPGVSDYEGYKESGWFNNDAFWWTRSATDWAYSTPWWPEWHPKYAVVHRYASYIIDGLNHWLTGYIDWNAVLDSIGGPTHVSNNCGAMLMADYQNDVLYFTPYYYVLKQFSRSMRPGDTVLRVKNPYLLQGEGLHLCASVNEQGEYAINILNTGEARLLPLQIGDYCTTIAMPANAVETIIISLPPYTPAPAAKAGTVIRDTIQGTPCRVYLPDRYEARAGKEIFPVLYLQHGMWGNENDWVEQGHLLHWMDSLLALRATKEMVIIMPDNCPHRATSEEERANAMSGAWEANFPQFMAETEQRYSVSSDPAQRAIAGLSMGGFHTMHISHYLHGQFAKVGLFSPAIRAPHEADVYANREEEVKMQLAQKPLYWIAIGREDFLYDNVAEYRHWLDENELPYTYYESAGGHTWANWQDYLCRFLQMI